MDKVSFHALAPGATVRSANISGALCLSARDLIFVVTGNHIQHAYHVWRTIRDLHSLVEGVHYHLYQFPGKGQRSQPLVSMRTAMMIVCSLPGKRAKAAKSKALQILDCLVTSN